MYLMIQNKGISPSEGFTLIGVSTTRNAGVAGTIGKFGSGTKFAINYLLRNNIHFTVYCGKLCIQFKTEKKKVSDGLREETFNQVVARLDCSEPTNQIHRTEKLSWTTEHGLDWTLDMALREFVANALDRTIREGQTAKDMQIEIVKDNQVRAKDGHTRIFIEFKPDVAKYYTELEKRFLHFKEPEHMKKDSILEKTAARAFDNGGSAAIYKEGVFVREYQNSRPALFDYNINSLPLDESRNAADWSIISYMSAIVAQKTDSKQRAKILKAVFNNDNFQEVHNLVGYQLNNDAENPEIRKAWLQTWEETMPKNSILNTIMPELNTHFQKKGYFPVTIKNAEWREFLINCKIPTEADILTETEKNGITEFEATPQIQEAARTVWEILKSHDALNGREFPKLKVFNKFMDGGSLTLGFYSKGTVFIHESLADGKNKMLMETMLEEIIHHVTGASDMSRDFQDYLIRLVIKIAL